MKRWTLTTKLVASVLLLFVAVTAAIGAATVFTMNRVLEGQAADQLQAQTQRLDPPTSDSNGQSGQSASPDDSGPNGSTRHFYECDKPDPNRVPLGGASNGGLLRLCTTGGGVVVGYSLQNKTVTNLSSGMIAQLRSAGLSDRPERLSLDGLGDYVVKAQDVNVYNTTTSTFATYTVYTGMSMARTHDSVQKLLTAITLSSLCGLGLMGLLATWIVQSNLRPLKRVAGTAQRVSQLELARGDVSLAERVPAEDTDTHTEVGQVGNALNQMLDHVDEALSARHESEQRVRKFVADASHELRTPLASIRGYAELSRKEREPVPAGVRHSLDRIESEAKRMTGLVEDMLQLARLDAGRPIERKPVDLTMMLIESIGDIQAAAPDHRWDLRLPDEAVEVMGDPGRLKQVVVNLLANARAHTPAGTSVVAALEPAADSVRIIVHDNGPGIPESLVPNLFQRFTRADEARNRAAGSTGLGLAIVDSVIKAHHGTIDVASKPGSTTFTVTLPR